MRRLLVVTILIAGCGDDSNRHIIDAPIVYPDGPTPDAPLAPVTLTVTSNGAVVPNVKVYFQNADSHVVSATMTDTTGVASAVMAPGGFVTALSPFVAPVFGGPTDNLFTFAGVKPGDHLVLDTPVYTAISIDVTLPFSAGAGVVQYTVSSSCSLDPGNDYLTIAPAGSGAPLTGTFYLYNCTTADVVIAAEDRAGHPVQYIYLANQTYTNMQAVDWSAMTYSDAVTTDFTYNNVPAGAFNFQLADRVATSHGLAYDAYGGQPTIGTTITEQLQLPTFTGAAGAVDADLQTSPNTDHHFIDWGPYMATATPVDVAARMVHEYNAFPAQSTTAPNTMTWSETTAGVDPDWLVMRMYVARTADAHTWGWTYAGPHAAGSFTLPTLPVDVYDFNIATNDNSTSTLMLMLKTPGGYDAARAHAFELLTFGPQTLIVGATGSLTVAEATQTTLNTRTKRPQAWQHFTSAVHVLRNRY